MLVTRMPYKDQLSKVSCEAGIAHRLKMKKGTKCQRSGRKSKNWRRLWNKEGLKETLEAGPEVVVRERVSQGKRVRGPKGKKRVPGWSTEEMKWKTLKN